MPDFMLLAQVGMAILTAAIIVLAAIAPLTASDKDNKVLAFLRRVEAFILKMLVPSSTLAKAKAPTDTK